MDYLNKLAPKHGWLDLAVITGLLLVINGTFAPGDLGWMQLQPSPWLLLPMLMGCRYGFPAGMAGAGVAIVIATIGFARQEEVFFVVNLLKQHGFLFTAMAAVGGISGQIQRGFKAREIVLTAQAERAGERLKKLDADVFLLREAKAELERLLATHDAELATLDAEIRRLFDSEGDELWQDILLLLNRQSRVSDAAIYTLADDGQSLVRKGLLGHARGLAGSRAAPALRQPPTRPRGVGYPRRRLRGFLPGRVVH